MTRFVAVRQLLKRLRGDRHVSHEIDRAIDALRRDGQDSASGPDLLESYFAQPGEFIRTVLRPWTAQAGWEHAGHAYRVLRDRLDQDNTWRYGTRRTRRLAQRYRPIAEHVRLKGARFIDFGCGPHNPLDIAVVLYINGAAEGISVDIRPPTDPRQSAVALYDLIAECLTLPERWHWGGVDIDEFLRRAHRFDREALRSGDLWGGLGTAQCRHVVGDDWQKEHDIDAIVSQSVLEHIHDLDGVIAAMSTVMRPGGVMLHRIDMRDHRRRTWGDGGINRWYFLTSDDEHSRSHCNRVRVSQFEALFERHGFEVVDYGADEAEPPAELRAKLLPQFQGLSDRDLRTVWARYLVRRR